MIRLLKIACYLGVLIFLLPSPPQEPGHKPQEADAKPIGEKAQSLLSVGVGMFDDLSGVCQRQPQVCGVVVGIFENVQNKIKYAIRLTYEWASDAPSQRAQPISRARTSPPTLSEEGSFPRKDGLTSEDVGLKWHGPEDSHPGRARSKEGEGQ